MKAFKALVLLSQTLLPCVQAQNSSQILAKAMEVLPKCALECMIGAISQSSCEMTDFFCITRNTELSKAMETCIKANCTIRESLIAKNFTESTFGGPVRDHTHLVSYISLIAGSVAVLAVILRIFARLPCCGGTWGLDDWAILVAMLPVLPLTGLSVPLANDGLGKDMWTVPFDKITHILHIYYFDESFYLSAIALTKISILLFYLRIFPNRDFRRAVYLTITLCALYILAFIPVTIFQCLPIHLAWERWDGEHHGKCINVNAEGWTSAAFNIIFDLVVICLPLRELSKLAMSRRRKVGIMLMFVGGGFVTVVSMLRLKWLVQFANTENVTWDYTPVGYWSTLEVHVGIIIACLPALRSLQHRLLPDTKHATAYYGGPSSAYGYSKGGSPFPSMGGFKSKPSQITTEASQASMVRSRDRTKQDKEFIQLEDYEIRLEGRHVENGEHIPRGENRTQIRRGSATNDDAALLNNQVLTALPERRGISPSRSDGLRVQVKREYSVDVESAPKTLNSLSSSPPRESEEDRVLPIQSNANFSVKR
ncbi:hypothetical protein EJ04DRAFT_565929 [Polyplosphaeria fusca]|uniref:Extracellular membrane protein CFEM domain-containing protein n=1 Tax=Polyplosphaeria fusca TaxID=682080 RepID=A0A9P4V0S2_9PLEO|nr:hypothetical protein EJ04DRAFT_565929 [Polyplosphaeria fusca]